MSDLELSTDEFTSASDKPRRASWQIEPCIRVFSRPGWLGMRAITRRFLSSLEIPLPINPAATLPSEPVDLCLPLEVYKGKKLPGSRRFRVGALHWARREPFDGPFMEEWHLLCYEAVFLVESGPAPEGMSPNEYGNMVIREKDYNSFALRLTALMEFYQGLDFDLPVPAQEPWFSGFTLRLPGGWRLSLSAPWQCL